MPCCSGLRGRNARSFEQTPITSQDTFLQVSAADAISIIPMPSLFAEALSWQQTCIQKLMEWNELGDMDVDMQSLRLHSDPCEIGLSSVLWNISQLLLSPCTTYLDYLSRYIEREPTPFEVTAVSAMALLGSLRFTMPFPGPPHSVTMYVVYLHTLVVGHTHMLQTSLYGRYSVHLFLPCHCRRYDTVSELFSFFDRPTTPTTQVSSPYAVGSCNRPRRVLEHLLP
ncbi:hypothetical protein GGS24DRAFT_473141 [Hypoxylon argillaceum]|nr:hypothetical protein GGS24DRAFT_473141 [Hypoxylon argillaceum]